MIPASLVDQGLSVFWLSEMLPVHVTTILVICIMTLKRGSGKSLFVFVVSAPQRRFSLSLLYYINMLTGEPGAYPEIWIGGGREEVGSRLLPSPRLPLPCPFPSLHLPSLPLQFPLLPLEVGPLIQLGGLGERCKLPQSAPPASRN